MIKLEREKAGLSQKDVANKLGITQARYSVIESCNIETLTVLTLKRLAEAFNKELVIKFVKRKK